MNFLLPCAGTTCGLPKSFKMNILYRFSYVSVIALSVAWISLSTPADGQNLVLIQTEKVTLETLPSVYSEAVNLRNQGNLASLRDYFAKPLK